METLALSQTLAAESRLCNLFVAVVSVRRGFYARPQLPALNRTFGPVYSFHIHKASSLETEGCGSGRNKTVDYTTQSITSSEQAYLLPNHCNYLI